MKKENMKLSIAQYNDMRKAQADGDEERVKRILELGHQKDYEPSMADSTEAELVQELEYDEQDILDDVAGGMENKEIYAKYSINAQRLTAIKKKAK